MKTGQKRGLLRISSIISWRIGKYNTDGVHFWSCTGVGLGYPEKQPSWGMRKSREGWGKLKLVDDLRLGWEMC